MSISKAEELKILKDAAAKLGNDSYLGPALLEMMPHLEADMRSDFIPDIAGRVNDLERRYAVRMADLVAIDAKSKERAAELRDLDRQVESSRRQLEAIRSEVRLLVKKLNDI